VIAANGAAVADRGAQRRLGAVVVVLFVVLVLGAVFVWPTRYAYGVIVYDTSANYEGGMRLDLPYRRDRFTGTVELYRSGAWRDLGGPAASPE
jgi:hypothetical protein